MASTFFRHTGPFPALRPRPPNSWLFSWANICLGARGPFLGDWNLEPSECDIAQVLQHDYNASILAVTDTDGNLLPTRFEGQRAIDYGLTNAFFRSQQFSGVPNWRSQDDPVLYLPAWKPKLELYFGDETKFGMSEPFILRWTVAQCDHTLAVFTARLEKVLCRASQDTLRIPSQIPAREQSDSVFA